MPIGTQAHSRLQVEHYTYTIYCKTFWKNGQIIVPLQEVSAAMLYLYKSQIRSNMEYLKLPSHHMPVLIQFKSSLLHNELFSTLHPLSHKQNVASHLLLYHYFHGKCFNELHSLVPPVLTFTAKTHHAVYSGMNHPHSLHKKEVPLDQVLHKNFCFVEQTLDRMFS